MRKQTVKLPDGVQVVSKRPELQPGQPWTGFIDPRHIKPNPHQPRTEFPEENHNSLR